MPQAKADVAASFQEAIVDVLVAKSLYALEQTGLDQLVVAGGVGANRRLRERLDRAAAEQGCSVFYPEFEFCTDNGAMIALAGALRLGAGLRNDPAGALCLGAAGDPGIRLRAATRSPSSRAGICRHRSSGSEEADQAQRQAEAQQRGDTAQSDLTPNPASSRRCGSPRPRAGAGCCPCAGRSAAPRSPARPAAAGSPCRTARRCRPARTRRR